MKIFRIYFAAAIICMIVTAAAGGIIEAENKTRTVVFGEEGAMPVVSLSDIEDFVNDRTLMR